MTAGATGVGGEEERDFRDGDEKEEVEEQEAHGRRRRN